MRKRSQFLSIFSRDGLLYSRHTLRSIAQEGRNHLACQLLVSTDTIEKIGHRRLPSRCRDHFLFRLRQRFGGCATENRIKGIDAKRLADDQVESGPDEPFLVWLAVVAG